MLDRHLLPVIKQPLNRVASVLNHYALTANQVTVIGFAVGMTAVVWLMLELYLLALLAIVFNRVCDGLDGALARIQGATDAGAFLDVTLDFIFYQSVVFGFILAKPENQLPGAFLMLAFVGTGISFLAFSIIAERRSMTSIRYPNKGIYYLGGLAEGTETIAFFIAFCLWPQHFTMLAIVFALICLLGASLRIFYGYRQFSDA